MAAELMAEPDVGAVPACARGRLASVVADPDIVVTALPHGQVPPSVCLGNLSQDDAVTVGADDSLEKALREVAVQQVRRLPAIDGGRLVSVTTSSVTDPASARGRRSRDGL